MGVSYNKLWKLLKKKKISVADLRRKTDIAPNTITKMRKNKDVSLNVLERICSVLDCDFGDIIEYTKE